MEAPWQPSIVYPSRGAGLVFEAADAAKDPLAPDHLKVLLDAGLLTRSRIARSVVYRRTPLGEALAAAAWWASCVHGYGESAQQTG